MTEIVKYFSKLDHFSLFSSKKDIFAIKTETAVSNKKNIENIKGGCIPIPFSPKKR